ncbi:putative methionine--tRNA ligase, mitochondrial [Grifola frondosa]|uniref:Probable methionine--tRNA ligase, mitochondrial n=1 Tax=Grifola frondosa TaxID=5627 RepID=A0A1C7M4W9_GRIFR|nr:putative methionine--tRNA ligase, mitochondrial [Grifola frondosa]
MEPLAFCDELSQHFRNLSKKANVSSTRFTRTTEREHCDAVQHLWRLLDAKGLIYKGQHEGWYSVSDECFYTDKQITRVDPPTDSEEEAYYISTETGSRVEWMHEENYKFRLSSFASSLAAHFTAHEDAIYPPQHHVDIVTSLQQPLEDLSISRPKSRLTWGIPVPNDPEHTIYVWIDALTVYLSSIGYPWSANGGKGLESGWPPDIQIIGKDILRFHAIYFPAMLQALDIPLPKRLLAHSHWTVNRAKMSKSVGNVADPIQAIDEFGIDLVRYYLARVGGRFKDDVDWSHEQLEKHSREIISLLGNLLMRITSAKIEKRVAGRERPEAQSIAAEGLVSPLLSSLSALAPSVESDMQNMQVANALETIVAALQEANMLVTQATPWHRDTPLDVTSNVQALVLECLRQCGILLQPFMPSKAELLLNALDVPAEQRTLAYAAFGSPGLNQVQRGIRLFEVPSLTTTNEKAD